MQNFGRGKFKSNQHDKFQVEEHLKNKGYIECKVLKVLAINPSNVFEKQCFTKSQLSH